MNVWPGLIPCRLHHRRNRWLIMCMKLSCDTLGPGNYVHSDGFKYFSGFHYSNSNLTKLHLPPPPQKNGFKKTCWSVPMLPQKLWCMSVSTAPALIHWRIPRCNVCIRQYRTIVTWNPATKHNGLMYCFLYPIQSNKCPNAPYMEYSPLRWFTPKMIQMIPNVGKILGCVLNNTLCGDHNHEQNKNWYQIEKMQATVPSWKNLV